MSSVVVVGGGIAGLVCAWRLRRAGHDVEVLERDSQPGGRMRTDEVDGFRVDRGAQFIASGYRNLHGVVRAVGLESAVRTIPRRGDGVLRDGRIESADLESTRATLRSPLLSTPAKLRLARLGLELFRHRAILEPLRPERAAALDGENLHDYLTRVIGAEARDFAIGPAIRATFDAELEDLSAPFLLLMLRMFAEGHRLQTLDGGLGRLPAMLAEQVPVRSGCEVLAIETEPDGARVRYRVGPRERSVVADAAVVAVPGNAVAGLCPKLTPAERGFFERVQCVRGMIVHLLLDAPAPVPFSGVAFPKPERISLYGIAVDQGTPGVVPKGAGMLNAALTESAARFLWDASDQEIAQHVVTELGRTPIGRLRPLRSVVHRWPAMLPQFGTGSLTRLHGFLERHERSPRLAFAGDYLISPTTEGALTSGMRAASDIVRALD